MRNNRSWLVDRAKIDFAILMFYSPVYNRTLLVLFHRSKEGDILLKAGGVAYALKKLESAKTREPTEEDKMLARYVVERINTKEKLVTQAMAGVAVQ